MPESTKTVDYLIIGAGIAGTVVRRFLHSDNVVLLDPKPGGYKIGESIIPEHFHHPIMRALVPMVKELDSYSEKRGTTFISSDSVASFPLPPHGADVSMHIARDELESLMHQEWSTPIIKERVTDIQLDTKTVITNKSRYQVRHQIIDCSGPAMVVARKCGEVLDLWPVYARWAYFNIDEVNDDRFWQSIKDQGQSYRRYDVPNGRLLEMNEDRDWRPSKTTCITEIRTGVWTWQIPIHDEKVLSFGVVSKTDKIDEEAFYKIASEHHAPQYTISKRPRDGSSSLNRFHLRNNFAQYASTPATLDYILVSDAYAFADPIFSVGTGLAVNKGIEVAALLNEGQWDQATCKRYCDEYKQLLDRAVKAFESWYDQSLMISDQAAEEAQLNFLVGTAFQVGVATHYSRVLMDSGAPLDQAAPGGGGRHALDPMGAALSDHVANLLELTDETSLAGWTFGGAYRSLREVQHRWTHPDKPEIVINTTFDASTTRYYRKVGNIALSFMNLWDRPYPFDDRCVALFDCLEQRISANSAAWQQLGQDILG